VTASLPVDGLVDGAWLAAHLSEVRVVDVRWYLHRPGEGRAAYDAGHIPGAVHLDVDTDLSDPPSPAAGRHPLPAPERFAAALGRAGIAEGTAVVGYDDAGGSIAARLWWLLDALGQPAAVLDGGLAAWPGELTTEVVAPVPVHRRAQPWPPDRFRGADELAGAALLDARTAERFAAGDPAVDPRPGHIPGARSAPWADNLDPTGRFLDPAALRARYADVLDGPVVAYCGSGVTACHDLLALRRAGVRDLALYAGSWSQWGADPARPAETGPAEPSPARRGADRAGRA
jgi:thiosulfate/3-mercaptopyruvate sulfurtransferase